MASWAYGLLRRRHPIPQCPARHSPVPCPTFPSALPDVLGTLNTAPSDRLAVAPGCSGAGPARVRNVSLSKRLTRRGNKEKATLWTLNPRNKNRKLCRQRP